MSDTRVGFTVLVCSGFVPTEGVIPDFALVDFGESFGKQATRRVIVVFVIYMCYMCCVCFVKVPGK